MKSLKLIGVLLVLAVLLPKADPAQNSSVAKAQKLIELGDTHADNEMAYLDLLAEALRKDPHLRGYLVAYSNSSMGPGDFLMRIYGYRDYLVNKRGIDPDRIELVPGGVKDKLYTELWLVPNEAEGPKPDSEFKLVPQLPLKFSFAYPDCPPEMTIYLYEFSDNLKFYAEALQANPRASAKIVVYSGKGSRRNAARIARAARALLIRNHGIGADRILTQAKSRRRRCSEVELWLMPAAALSSKVRPDMRRQRTGIGVPTMDNLPLVQLSPGR